MLYHKTFVIAAADARRNLLRESANEWTKKKYLKMSQLIKSLKLHAYKEFMTVLCVRGGVLWNRYRFACYTSQESSEILFRAFKPILRVSWEQKCTECHSWAHLKSSLNSFVCVLLCDCYYYDYDDGKKVWHEVFQDNRSDTYDVRINEGDVTVKKISRSDLFHY